MTETQPTLVQISTNVPDDGDWLTGQACDRTDPECEACQ